MPSSPSRQRYVLGDEENQGWRRLFFLTFVERECPDVLSTLEAKVLPSWRLGAEALWQRRMERPEAFRFQDRKQCFEHVRWNGVVPECAKAKVALGEWASRFHLSEPFIRDAAVWTMRSWEFFPDLFPPSKRGEFYGHLIPGNSVRPPLEPLKAWDLTAESEFALRQRFEQHIRAQKAFAKANGLRLASSALRDDRLTWFVWWQVKEWSAEKIARKWARRETLLLNRRVSVKPPPIKTVEGAIRKLCASIGIRPRTEGKPGRPSKRR